MNQFFMKIKLLMLFTTLTITSQSFSTPLNTQILEAHPNQITKQQNTDVNRVNTENFLLQRKGAGKNNVMQGIALDMPNTLLYTSHAVTKKPETVAINQFKFQNAHVWQAQSAQKPSPLIRHQGISVDPSTGLLLASAGSSVENRGWHIVQFKYAANQLPINPRTIKVFGDGYSKSTNSMPIVSPDAQYLLVRGNKNKQNVVRVFKHEQLSKTMQNDLSNQYLYEWKVDSELTQDNYPLQAMTTDGKYVYFMSGRSNPDQPKRIFVYTLKGKLIQKVKQVLIGQQYAALMSQSEYWEPEGLSYNPTTKQLYILFAVGDHGKRLGLVYKLNLS